MTEKMTEKSKNIDRMYYFEPNIQSNLHFVTIKGNKGVTNVDFVHLVFYLFGPMVDKIRSYGFYLFSHPVSV